MTTEPKAEGVLEWSATLCDGKNVDYAEAEKACAALGDGWRLPTRMELESLLDLSRHDPCIDTERFPDTKSKWYWTSTPCAWSSVRAWIVCFYYGYANYGLRGNSDACVRAVRSVPSAESREASAVEALARAAQKYVEVRGSTHGQPARVALQAALSHPEIAALLKGDK